MADEMKEDMIETPAQVPAPVVVPEVVEAVAEPDTVPAAEVIAAEDLPAKRKPGRPRKDEGEQKAEAPASEIVAAEEPAVTVEVASAPEAEVPALKVRQARQAKPRTPAKTPAAAVAPVKVAAPRAKAKPAPRKSVASVPPKTTAPIKNRVIPAAAPFSRSAPASRKEHSVMTTTANEFTEKFQSAVKGASDKAKLAFGDAGEFAKGNVEAIVQSGKILATGMQEMGKSYVAESKSAMETMTSELKGLASVKSPTEFFEKQSALLRKQFDAAVAASSKNSEAMLKLANEAFQPISTRVSLAVEKMKQAA
ncbi:phasin family protein [Novosphingobium sp. KCTC 2891]|uniref:phasin family protein n=1 Tax=Novosphingobium sp. KCTC 2891 TaxID=2989730 RepID=UPI002221D7B7|nr:phasin family protein [Novosphingobium sp. KCTC 2891]MCW1381943.1 phasin family protein [Novosphingobium sp. KCTC 2891]